MIKRTILGAVIAVAFPAFAWAQATTPPVTSSEPTLASLLKRIDDLEKLVKYGNHYMPVVYSSAGTPDRGQMDKLCKEHGYDLAIDSRSESGATAVICAPVITSSAKRPPM